MIILKHKLLFTAALLGILVVPIAGAQTYDGGVDVEDMSKAQAYDVGAIDINEGALPPTLWNGTSASVATTLIEAAPSASRSAVVTDMVTRVLLSAGAPPNGEDGDKTYVNARLSKLISLGRSDALDAIFAREPNLARGAGGQRLKTDAALRAKDSSAACLIADGISEGRAEPYWAKLRAFCHVERGEIRAAELTMDLLQQSGHDDAAFYAALMTLTGVKQTVELQGPPSALLGLMIARIEGGAIGDDPLATFISDAPGLSRAELDKRLTKLSIEPSLVGGQPDSGEFDLNTMGRDISAASWGRLYGAVKSSSDGRVIAKAATLLLSRAEEAGIFTSIAHLIAPQIETIPSAVRAEFDPKIWSRLAVREGDLYALRPLYDFIGAGDPFRARVALASDALGNGFVLGQLGEDMTSRVLAKDGAQNRAVRDVFIATALGAQLSDPVAQRLTDGNFTLSGRRAAPSQLLALESAARKGAQAETALRAAIILGNDGPHGLEADSLSRVIRALYAAGLTEFATRLAAEDFIGR